MRKESEIELICVCVCVCVCESLCYTSEIQHCKSTLIQENKIFKKINPNSHYFNSTNCLLKVKSLSRVQLFVTPWTVAYQASHSMGFSRQEYWSGLPFPSPGDLPDPGIEPGSPAL